MWNGKFLAVELKSGIGKQSPDQVLFENAVTQAGGIYILARTVDDIKRGITNASSDGWCGGQEPAR